ncbi:SDR family NAD(P)-dependent oxidoreductase [bacterium]|nr:SDR family NAD(P)-dependent oxidoreductase [bacterium]
MEKKLENQVILITGAGGGLGRSHALLMAKLGAKIIVNDPGVSVDGSGQGLRPADETVSLIQQAGGQAVANYDFVDSFEGAQKMVGQALESFGRLDAVVNNAGILRDGSFKKQDTDQWQKIVDVHLTGSRHVTKAAWEIFLNQKYGRVVFTTSGSALFGNFGQTNYAAAKLGLVGLMHALKEEGSKNNIMVNTIAPVAASRMTQNIFPPDMLSKFDPAFVSPVVGYFCSPACQVTGQVWSVGAGHVARVAFVESEGINFNDSNDMTIDSIAEKMGKITQLENGKTFTNVMEEMAHLLTGK